MTRFSSASLRMAAVCAAFVWTCSACARPSIVEDGRPLAQIVVADPSPRMVKLAAMELQHYVQKMSDARLPIVTEPAGELPVKLYVGRSAHTDRLGVTAEGLKFGAYRLVSGPDWLVLLGNDFDYVPPEPWGRSRNDATRALAEWDKRTAKAVDTKWGFPFQSQFKSLWNRKDQLDIMFQRYGEDNRKFWKGYEGGFWLDDEGGSLNAVHEFLRMQGVRWYMPGTLGEVVPARKTIALAPVDKIVRPDSAVRSWTWYNYSGFSYDDVIWARRLGMNGGYEVLGDMGYAHGLTTVHRRQEMKDAHPEYYALIGGKRDVEHRGSGTACYTSDGLVAETVKFARFLFDEYGQPHVSIWPADGFMRCECKTCLGKSPSELVWGFVDRVGRELYKTHPDKLVSCGAYSSYIEPPAGIEKFSPNVGVFISNRGRSLMGVQENWDSYWASVENWRRRVAPGRILRVENNRPSLGAGGPGKISFPAYHPRAMAKDLRALKGVSLGECCEESQAAMKWVAPGIDHLNLYVQSQFLWDADQDIEALISEYCTLFFGPAAAEMKAAIDFAEAARNAAGINRDKKVATPGAVPISESIRLGEMLRAAREKAGDSVYGKRIQLILDEMKPLDKLRHDLEEQLRIGDPRAKAPVAVGQDLVRTPEMKTYRLGDIVTGEKTDIETTFQIGWDRDALVVRVRCQEPDMKNLFVTTDVWTGDSVAILLETQQHAYYQIEINPDGVVFDADRQGRVNANWSSLAQVKAHRGADFWIVEARIPVVDAAQGEMDPNHNVVGSRPTAEDPWFFNIGRVRVRDGKSTHQIFSPVGKVAFHVPVKFGKLVIE